MRVAEIRELQGKGHLRGERVGVYPIVAVESDLTRDTLVGFR
mgnify:CR=1 FL=1